MNRFASRHHHTGATAKQLRARGRLIGTILLIPLLVSCGHYLDTSPDRKLVKRVEERLKPDEGLPLPAISQLPPQTVEQALPKFKEGRPKSTATLPPPSATKPELPKAAPEASKQLSIATVRSMALENNLDLKIAQADPKIAATAVSEEEAKFDDLIFAKAKYGKKNTPSQNLDVVSFTPVDPNSALKNEVDKLTAVPQETKILDMEAGIVIPLRTGAKITVSSPFDGKRQFRGVASDQYQNALRFSISQPLLRDAGISNNVVGIRIARYEQQAVDVKTRLQVIRVLAMVERAYWSLYVAWGELDVRRQQYENASNNLNMVRKRVAEGLTANVEINRAEIGVAERLESLIIAETSLKTRQRQLKLLLNAPGLDLDSQTLLIPDTSPTLLEFNLDREQLAQRALDGRLELLELELKLAADLTKIDYLNNQTLPMFMLDYNYAALGRDTSSYGGAFDQTLNGNYSDWSVGVRMEIPLSNELRRARLDRAVQERMQRLTTQQLRELSVRREIYDSLDQMSQNWQRILATRQNVVLAGLNYDAELKQFKEGLRTMTEVLETLTRLGEAQLREVRAIGDYQVSMIDLAFATGTLLGHSRVDLGLNTTAQSIR
jgi:outer membrane protein TolC